MLATSNQTEGSKETPKRRFLRKSASSVNLSPAQRMPIKSLDGSPNVFVKPFPKPDWNDQVVRIPEKTKTNLTPYPSKINPTVNQLSREFVEYSPLKKTLKEKKMAAAVAQG
jgi:hypothetical protein